MLFPCEITSEAIVTVPCRRSVLNCFALHNSGDPLEGLRSTQMSLSLRTSCGVSPAGPEEKLRRMSEGANLRRQEILPRIHSIGQEGFEHVNEKNI